VYLNSKLLSEELEWSVKSIQLQTRAFDLIYKFCSWNNLGKCQVFGEKGIFYIIEMLKGYSSEAAIFLLKMTNSKNFGSFMGKKLFKALTDVYKKTIEEVLRTFQDNEFNSASLISQYSDEGHEPTPEGNEQKRKAIYMEKHNGDQLIVFPSINNENFNHTPYTFLLILNRFFKELFIKEFADEERYLRNSFTLQEIIIGPLTKGLVSPEISDQPVGKSIIDVLVDLLGSSVLAHDIHGADDFKAEHIKPMNEIELLKFMSSKEILSYSEKQKLLRDVCCTTLSLMNQVSYDGTFYYAMKHMREACSKVRLL
jgi:hypothetical protein